MLCSPSKRFAINPIAGQIPFGCSVEYQPASPNYKDAGHALGSKTRRSIFFGYHSEQGGVPKGDLLIVDELQMDTAAHPVRVVPTRIRMGEVFKVTQSDGTFELPIAAGSILLNMPDHIYADLDTSYKHSHVPGRRLSRKVNREIVASSDGCAPVEENHDVAIPGGLRDAPSFTFEFFHR